MATGRGNCDETGFGKMDTKVYPYKCTDFGTKVR